ncbi:MAG: hypothetical protein PGN16_10645 [Sphingomonas phyllosphaerae]|uniref:hypothetical protein n=1 Tax=Sphingomonas phyllosphaerae TaxID=257003 RepID=UPI002FFA0BEA
MTSALRSFSPLVQALDELAASAWRASPKKLLALSPAIGGQITAAFRAARTVKDGHALWFQERNDLMVLCNAPGSMSEEEHDQALSRLSELELLVLDTPATSQEDLLVQMVLATQLSAEGSTIDEDRAKRLVGRSIALVSVGTLAGTALETVK